MRFPRIYEEDGCCTAAECDLCGGEIYRGRRYYRINGQTVCPDCLADYARAVFAGFAFHDWFIEPLAGEEFWRGSLYFDAPLAVAMHEVPMWVKLSASVVMLLGLFGAWYAYIRKPETPAKFTDTFRVLSTNRGQ